MTDDPIRLRFDDTTHPIARDRVAAWRDAMSLSVDVAFRAEERSSFRGAFDLYKLGSVILVESGLTPHAMMRSKATIARTGTAHVVLDAFPEGGFRGTVGGRPLVVGPGDCFVMDLAATLRVQLDATRYIGVIMPRRLFEAHVGHARSMHGTRLEATTPEARCLLPALEALVAEAPRLGPARAAALGIGIVGLIGACLSDHEAVPGSASDLAFGEPTLARVLRHIERHASDPDLDARRIGVEFNLSRTALYRLLAAHGGPAEIIRARRAAIARRLLGDPSHASWSIEAVAGASGFANVRTLGRALRDLYGAPPSQLRQPCVVDETAASEHRIKIGALLDSSAA